MFFLFCDLLSQTIISFVTTNILFFFFQIRLDAYALLCENIKMTEPLTEEELPLLLRFVKENMNSQIPAFRQSLVSYTKKVFFLIWFLSYFFIFSSIGKKSKNYKDIMYLCYSELWIIQELWFFYKNEKVVDKRKNSVQCC